MNHLSTLSRRSLLPLLILGLGLAALMPTRVAADSWVQIESQNFTIIGNISERQARRAAFEFEEVRRAITLFFPGLSHDPTRLTVYAIDNEARASELIGRNMERVAGLFYNDPTGAFAFVRMDVDTQYSFGVAYHEYFHSVTANSLPGLPLWLNEGLAEIWSSTTIDKKGIQLGKVLGSHMQFLGYNKMANIEGTVQPDAAAAAYANPEKRGNLYAQSWALTHYMMFGDGGERWPKLLRYLNACANGVDEREAWLAEFPPRDKVTKDVWRYLNGRRFSFKSLEVASEEDSTSYAARALTPGEVSALHGSLLVRAGDKARGRKLIDTALTAYEADSAALSPEIAAKALAALASLVTQVNPTKAKEHLQRALEIAPDAHYLRYRLGVIEALERAEGWQDRFVDHMLTAGTKVPGFGLPFLQVAKLYWADETQTETSLALAKRALQRMNGSPEAHLLMAGLMNRKGATEEALFSIRFARHLAINSQGAGALNLVCWRGTLYGLAGEALPACDHAITRTPDSSTFRDSRALARAVTGDSSGAIADWEIVLADETMTEKLRETRSSWVKELTEGRNPITPEVLAGLLIKD